MQSGGKSNLLKIAYSYQNNQNTIEVSDQIDLWSRWWFDHINWTLDSLDSLKGETHLMNAIVKIVRWKILGDFASFNFIIKR